MKIVDYLKDKSLYLAVNLMTFIIVATLMYFSNVSTVVIFMTWCIWFLPLLIYIIIEYIKYKKYFDNIENVLKRLDKKYLLPEVIEEPNSIIGEEVNDILKEISRDMHEHVKYYRNMQEEYREYIEMWVHEIKTPIATCKLLIENNENEVTESIGDEITKVEDYI